MNDDELWEEYREYYDGFHEEENEDGELVLRKKVNGRKIQAIDFETFKAYKKEGIIEELEKATRLFNGSLSEVDEDD